MYFLCFCFLFRPLFRAFKKLGQKMWNFLLVLWGMRRQLFAFEIYWPLVWPHFWSTVFHRHQILLKKLWQIESTKNRNLTLRIKCWWFLTQLVGSICLAKISNLFKKLKKWGHALDRHSWYRFFFALTVSTCCFCRSSLTSIPLKQESHRLYQAMGLCLCSLLPSKVTIAKVKPFEGNARLWEMLPLGV